MTAILSPLSLHVAVTVSCLMYSCDDRTESNYSGLYSYHIPTNRWRKLRGPDDDRNTRSRFGHSMQFDQVGCNKQTIEN